MTIRWRSRSNVYLLASASGITACIIGITTAFVTPLQRIEGGSLVWLFASLCGTGFALASAYSWRQQVKWFQRPTFRTQPRGREA